MKRQNEYRNKEFAQAVAAKTGGTFIDKEFSDKFGKYWIVIWEE